MVIFSRSNGLSMACDRLTSVAAFLHYFYILHEYLLQFPDIPLRQPHSHRRQPRVKMRIHITHVLFIDYFDEDGGFVDGVVETIEVEEVHMLFVGFLELAEAQSAGGELRAGFVRESVQFDVRQLE